MDHRASAQGQEGGSESAEGRRPGFGDHLADLGPGSWSGEGNRIDEAASHPRPLLPYCYLWVGASSSIMIFEFV